MDVYTKKDVCNIMILVAVSLILGIYLIVTTVMISRDGVLYVERSKELTSQFHQLIKDTPPIGLDILIVSFHRTLSAFSKSTSPESWILSGQICVLACKTVSMVVLYFFGICFFNRKHVFASLLILAFLPYVTHFGSDILRDWPHVLFLFSAMFFLVKGIRRPSWFYLMLAGVTCGLGQIIRPECAQVLIYGAVIFCFKLGLWLLKKEDFSQKHVYLFLLAGFLVVSVPYWQKREKIIPGSLKSLFVVNNCSDQGDPDWAASLSSANIFDSSLELAQTITEDFNYYFIFPAAIGFYFRFFRKNNFFNEKTLPIVLFISFNCVILMLLHSHWGYISRRHALPLCIMLSFYIPTGITAIASYINIKTDTKNRDMKKWGQILFLAGILVCLPKLLRPMGMDKKNYLEAANWIETHTATDNCFLTFDSRIPFYGKRQCWQQYLALNESALKTDYWIVRVKNGVLKTDIPAEAILEQTFEGIEADREIRIYRRME